MDDASIIAFFASYAYRPDFVYLLILIMMTASSFGLPIPEEVTLVSAGLVGHMSLHPDLYPPPSADAAGVQLWLLCVVCFLAVLGSDLLIYLLGKYFGRRIVEGAFFQKHVGQDRLDKISRLFEKHGHIASGFFRFTPGVRFPGHLSCGIMGVPIWKFILIDGTAALISVPTQVLLVAYYGQIVVEQLRQVKIVAAIIVALIFLFFSMRFLFRRWQATRNKIQS